MSNKDELIKELLEKHNEIVLKALSTFENCHGNTTRKQVIPESIYDYTAMVLKSIENIVKY